jgi:hypothetical protein
VRRDLGEDAGVGEGEGEELTSPAPRHGQALFLLCQHERRQIHQPAQAAFNYHERGMATMLWTAAVDDRAEHLGPDGRLPAAWACMPMPIALVRRPTCGRR